MFMCGYAWILPNMHLKPVFEGMTQRHWAVQSLISIGLLASTWIICSFRLLQGLSYLTRHLQNHWTATLQWHVILNLYRASKTSACFEADLSLSITHDKHVLLHEVLFLCQGLFITSTLHFYLFLVSLNRHDLIQTDRFLLIHDKVKL